MTDTKPVPVVDLPSDELADSAADAAADAEIEAGEGISHETARAWLLKLAKGEKLPPPIP